MLHRMTPAPSPGRAGPMAVASGLLPVTASPPAATAVTADPAVLPSSPGAPTGTRTVPGAVVPTPPVSIPDVPQPAPTLPAQVGPSTSRPPARPGRSAFHLLGGGVALLAAPIAPVTLGTAERLRVPIAFASVLTLFLAGQALVSRRDPKLSRSPMRRNDDTLPFT
jgi:hypothetical protein